jgi:hypothetical protein
MPASLFNNMVVIVGSNVFVGTDYNGVFASTNNGASWTTINSGLTNTNVFSVGVCGTYLFAGTGNGLWRRPLSEVVAVVRDHHASVPTGYRLKQNYPNPFNPSTTLSFALPAESFVTLVVRDVLGRVVANILSETLPPGFHSRRWNAGHLSAGVYFCTLTANLFIDTKKIVLLK